MTEKTYVYEKKEYKLTGRTATKTLRSSKTKTLHEIRPSEADPTNNAYNVWVELDELYEIKEKEIENEA
jgi:hypothetical protein